MTTIGSFQYCRSVTCTTLQRSSTRCRQTDRHEVTPLSRVTAAAHVTMPSGTKSYIILCAFSSHGPREIGTIIGRHPDLLPILRPFFEEGVCWTQARERIGARAERETGPAGAVAGHGPPDSALDLLEHWTRTNRRTQIVR